MIDAQSLHKRFPAPGGRRGSEVLAVENVSFKAEDGEITGLLGPNGAGKSTTLRMLATLMHPDNGTAVIDRFDIVEAPLKARQCIGFMPHNSGVYPRLTARENIRYYARLCGVAPHGMEKRIDALVAMLDMETFIDRRTAGFSQGQKTKVALARALVHEPQTLMLDEPTNGLDVMATRGLRKILRRIADEGHCVLFSTHIMPEVAGLCDHIAIISRGNIAYSDSLSGILEATGRQDLEEAFIVAIGGDPDSDSYLEHTDLAHTEDGKTT